MRVLLTFTGSHDPFSASPKAGEERAGPVLTVLAERRFDAVYLFTTPRMAAISDATRQEIATRYPDTSAEILEVPLKDPTNYLGILRQIRKHFTALHRAHPSADYAIAVSSGTPQMHACWLLLAASGEVPAVILQTVGPDFVKEGGACVREIDLATAEFPQVTVRQTPTHPPRALDDQIATFRQTFGIVGDDPAFVKALTEAATYAEYDETHVLLLGETGTGKERFTELIHQLSARATRPLVVVNCSSIPAELAESQLFGHKKGSFTGATSDQQGKFKAADGGILFLDELGELSPSIQAKLLRALEFGEIEPVGAGKPVKVNVRVIAATNRDLRQMVAAGTFREDLYQRFGAAVRIPSLRQRRSDIPKLALHLLSEWNRLHKKQRSFSGKALTALARYDWPGNVRELSRVIRQSAMLSERAVLTEDDLRFELPVSSNPLAAIPEPGPGFDLQDYLVNVKRKVIQRALEKSGGVQAQAARLLGVSPQALNQLLKSGKHQDV